MKQLFFPLLAVVLCGSTAMAALDLSEIGVGARPLGLGRAYVGLADDANAIFTNPAGLARNKNLNLTSMSGALLGDINYVLIGAANESPLGKFGVGYINAAVTAIPLTRLVGSGPSLEAQQYDSTDYGSSLVLFSYGSKLSRFLRNGAGQNVSLGATLKLLSQGFSGGGSAMQNANGSGMDADLGVLWETNSKLSLGLTLQNFLPATFGGKFTWQKNGVIEGIPLITRAGGHYALWSNLDLMCDYEKSQAVGRPGVFHLGSEFWPIETLALRLGLDQKPRATESGVGVDNNLTAGVGFAFGGFTFDYAYHQFGELSENATHFFSLGYRGTDREKLREKAAAEKKNRRSTIPQPEIVAKPKLKSFSDVPDGYWAKKPIEYLSTLGIMGGYGDNTFRPTQELTRGELAVLLVKAKGFTVGTDVRVRFKDVPLQSFEAPYISFAVERKYINGYPDKAFRPQNRVTRAEGAMILARWAGLYQKPKLAARPFPDMPVDHWASPAVAATKTAGLFEYLSGQSFGPKLNLTRAEAAEIISKAPFAKKQIEKLISGGEE
ncbi:MAG: S-layer homology domain-containing protein [Candidatus Margulisiibacteriota bacterium]